MNRVSKFEISFLVFQCCFSVSRSLNLLALFTLTNCDEQFECSNALFNENRMVLHHSTTNYSEDVRLCTMDVENNHEKLLETIFPLTDGVNVEMECRNKDWLNISSDQSMVIFTFLSFELTRTISSLILPFNFHFLVCVTEKAMYPPYFLDHPNAVYSYEASFGQGMHRDGFMKIKSKLNISYMAILNLKENQVLGNISTTKPLQQTAWQLYTKECPKDCYKQLDVNINNASDIRFARSLISNNSISFLVLSGEILAILRFRETIQSDIYQESFSHFYLQFTFKTTNYFSVNYNMTSYINHDVIMNFPGAFAVSSYLYYLSDLKFLLLETDRI